jgi:predicted RNase H-like HicB family nuclease
VVKTERQYPKEVFWSEEDEGYIAIAPDLNGCSAFGVSEAEALRELDDAIATWILAAKAANNPIPAPTDKSAPQSYSGKFMTRIAKSLHRDLALRAKQEGVSLNALVGQMLASRSSTPS